MIRYVKEAARSEALGNAAAIRLGHCSVVLVSLVLVALCGCMPPSEVGSMRKATVSPISVAEARQQLQFPFPDTASNVQFSSYREFLAAEDFVRFQAPVDDCIATAEEIVGAHNRSRPSDQVAGVRVLTADHPSEFQSEGTPAWFTPHTIEEGFIAGEEGSHMPLIWIDTARGYFFYQYGD